jgi:hypothetical protein
LTDDKALLRDRIARSTKRQAALELVRDSLLKLGLLPEVSPPLRSARPVSRFRPLRPLRALQRQQPVSVLQRIAQASHQIIHAIGSWSERLRQKTVQITQEQTKKAVLQVAKTIPPPEVKITPEQSLGRGVSR